MYAARGKAAAEAFLRNETLAGVQERPLGERASELPRTAPRGATRCARWNLRCREWLSVTCAWHMQGIIL